MIMPEMKTQKQPVKCLLAVPGNVLSSWLSHIHKRVQRRMNVSPLSSLQRASDTCTSIVL